MLSTEFKTQHSFAVPRIELRALWMLSEYHSGLELPVFFPSSHFHFWQADAAG